MEPGWELSSEDAALLTRDKALPFLFSEELGGCVQGCLAGMSAADGRAQDNPGPLGQLQDSAQEIAGYGSTGDAGSVPPANHQYRYPIRERIAVTPGQGPRQQPGFAVPQSSASSANNTTSYGTKANSSEKTRKLRTLAPLPASSPFILKSQTESMVALKPFPADSPLVLRSQPEKRDKGGESGF